MVDMRLGPNLVHVRLGPQTDWTCRLTQHHSFKVLIIALEDSALSVLTSVVSILGHLALPMHCVRSLGASLRCLEIGYSSTDLNPFVDLTHYSVGSVAFLLCLWGHIQSPLKTRLSVFM